MPMCDFDRLAFEIRPCDVLLVEGRSRVSDIIKNITQTAWTHSAIYIGRLSDIENPAVRALVAKHHDGDEQEQLLIEALLGQGTIVTPLRAYRHEHLRICRPRALSMQDAQRIVEYCAGHLGVDYDVRQLIDLARLLYPYAILPRRWRSTLFEHNAGIPTRTVCSSMIAAAFSHVHYPILPVVQRGDDGRLHLYKRNARLHTPRDFDYSPYFDIIKYPFLGFDDMAVYRQLPWNKEGVICNDENDCFVPDTAVPAPVTSRGQAAIVAAKVAASENLMQPATGGGLER
ncbi:MAG TPA: hypothetical protein ENJ19_05345 [Gammaproteobacteria bacterium]|nr:hypothetical protein [Gammaproteobacteria bacterium]